MRFRPCIDLRNGRVVQIVGGSLRDDNPQSTVVNFESERSAADYAAMYRRDGLSGGHVIALGPGNQEAAFAALGAYPGGLQYGGGVTPENAAEYLDAGASHVIATSCVFRQGRLDRDALDKLVETVGRSHLVLDLSCRRRDGRYIVVTDRWQKFSDLEVNAALLADLAEHCDEFLVHGVDVEGRRMGIEAALVEMLGRHSPIPVTYAGGVASPADLELIERLGGGRVDATVGSALDIFGGNVAYAEILAWHRRREG